jgi:hypothetical protein
MAFNFFGALGAFSRALPGYVQGERMAVQDNWNDLNQYNKVQSGQIQNAWDEAVFNPRLTREYDQAAMSNIGVADSTQNYFLNSLNRGRAYRQSYRDAGWDDVLGDMNNMARLGSAYRTSERALFPQDYGFGGADMGSLAQLSRLYGAQNQNPYQSTMSIPSVMY